MGILAYTLLSYGLTVVISLLVVAIIVAINKMVSRAEKRGEAANND